MFARKERSPSPMRANYDFALRHERSKLFLKIASQVDGHAARTAQAMRDLAACFSQVGQSYYEVSLCVNNVNPSTASILQAKRAPVEAELGRDDAGGDGNEAEYSLAAPVRTGGRNYEMRKDLVVTHKGREGDIGYTDGVVQQYGTVLQTAAKVFASETRTLKEGKLFAAYSEGVHKDVLGRLKEIELSAKQTVESGNETEKLFKKYLRAKKLVSLKEKKYARLEKPLSASKRYEKQVAAMRKAEGLYTARLASFDEKYEHLFQRDLYVTGHTLDNFLDVSFTFLAHLMQRIGSLAPSAAEVLETVFIEGGDALGKRMGIAENNRLGSKVKARRGSAPTADAAAVAATARRSKPEASSSHNFTNYFSTRREVRNPTGNAQKKAAGDAKRRGTKEEECAVDVEEAPPTAKNNDEVSVVRPAAARGATPKVTKPPRTAAGTAAETTPTPGAGRAFAPCEDEPEPRRPHEGGCAAAATWPEERTPVRRANSNAPFGNTPNPTEADVAAHPQRAPGAGGVKHKNKVVQPSSPPVSRAATVAREGSPGLVLHTSRPLIVKRNPSRSPSCEPYGYAALQEEVRAASVAYTACSRVQEHRESDASDDNAAAAAKPPTPAPAAADGAAAAVRTPARLPSGGGGRHAAARPAAPRAAKTAAPAQSRDPQRPANAVARRPSSPAPAPPQSKRPGTPRTASVGVAAAAAVAAAVDADGAETADRFAGSGVATPVAAAPTATASPVVSAPPAEDESDTDAGIEPTPPPHRPLPIHAVSPAAACASLGDSGGGPRSPGSGSGDGRFNGRPTVAAVPGAALKGFASHSSFASLAAAEGLAGHLSSTSGGWTPQGQTLSSASTPPPPHGGCWPAHTATDPFFSAAWEEGDAMASE